MPATIVAVEGVPRALSGLASGVLNTSRFVGAALGLAVLSTIAAHHTDSEIASGTSAAKALTDGFQLQFGVGAVFCLVGRGRRRRSCCARSGAAARRRAGTGRQSAHSAARSDGFVLFPPVLRAPLMRFYEFESRRIVERAGIPVTEYGFAKTAAEAREAAERIGGPTVIKSQVLTGGRMKAGGVKFADTPDEAEAHAAEILELEINGHMPVGVLVDPKAEVEQEYYAAVLWDGRAKRPMMLFSDMGGIDIEEVAEKHPDHVGRGHLSNLHPIPDFRAKEVVAAAGGLTGRELTRATPVLARLAQLQRDYDMTLAEINPLARLSDGSFVALDAHMEMEDEAVGRHQKMLAEIGVELDEPRELYEPSEFERNVKAIDEADHRGVIQGKDHGFEGNLGLVIGAGGGSLTLTDAVRSQGGKPANYAEIGGNPSVAKSCGLAKEVLKKDGVEKIAVMMSIVSNTRVDIVARGVIKACLELGKDPAETITVFRIPGAWEEEGAKILGKYGDRVPRPLDLDVGGRRRGRREGPGGGGMSILLTRTSPSSSRASPAARRST